MSDLQEQYVAALEAQADALESALAAGDDGEVRRIAHQLKGSGASFGFPEITAAAAAVIDAAAAATPGAAAALVERLHAIVSGSVSPGAVVLVVDDDPAIRMLLRAALAGRFDRIDEAGSIAAAREALDGPPPSLILLDLVLGDGDGREFLTEIRSEARFERVPIGVLSAHSRDDVRDECIRLGADGYLQKPFRPEEIGERVDALRAAGHRPRPAAAAATPTAGARRSPVLVAEDDPLTAGLVVDRLRRRGYDVIHCSDGRAAVEAAQRRNLAMAIIDVAMPQMNGFEVLGKLRGMKRHATTPILILTGMSDEQSVVRAFDLGADDYVLKPFSPTELAARVDRMTAG